MRTRPAFGIYALPKEDTSLAGEGYPAAGLVCLFGFFLHLILSDPLINSIFGSYSSEQLAIYQKVHPGSVFILLSFGILLWSKGNPFRKFFVIYKEHMIFLTLAAFYILMFFYMLARSGVNGSAFIIDTHLTAPVSAIVLCYTPLSYCRRAIYLFMGIAMLNSMIGIVEAVGKFRIFSFDPNWGVLNEDYFRASALRGHPLNNAMFTAIALFVSMSLPYSKWRKAFMILLFMTSQVAFGGRAALVVSVLGFLTFEMVTIRKLMYSSNLTILKVLLTMIGIFMVPVVFAGGLYGLINSSMGERIASHMNWDESANTRVVALTVFDYMRPEEILFGVSNERTIDIAQQMNARPKLIDIENPWLLMFLQLGIIAFIIWCLLTFAFMLQLMRRQPLGLKLAVISYYITASMSNSFGRRDSTYLIMVCAVVCATRALIAHKQEEEIKLRTSMSELRPPP